MAKNISVKEKIKIIEKKIKKEKIDDAWISNIIKENIWIYWMYVNYNRAFQDIRDWMKPVWRRLLWWAYENKLFFNAVYKKSANIVWYVMWNYHPHWDSYWTLVYLAQDFSLKYPLIDPQGNFWWLDWSWAAASRYTEARLSKISQSLLLDEINEISKDKYFKPNYSWEKLEPIVLPAKLPFALLNWTTWIWLWKNTRTISHNINEVIDAIVWLLKIEDNKKFKIEKYIKWPDTAWMIWEVIIDKDEYKKIYKKSWLWKVTIRWKIEIKEWKKSQIVVKSLPSEVTITSFLDKLEKAVKNKKIPWIKKVNTFWVERDKKIKTYALNIVIDIDKKENINKIIKKLYKNTNLEQWYNLNYTFISNNRVETFNVTEILNEFIEFRKEILLDIFSNRIKKLEREKLILEAKLLALNNLDEVIKIIRNANSDEEVLKKFEKKLWIKKEYWEIILEMQLRNIKKLDKMKLKEKLQEIKSKIAYYKKLIKNKKELINYMIEEYKSIKKEFWEKRLSKIIHTEKITED